MPSLIVIYYAGLIPISLMMTARAMYIANRRERYHLTRPTAVAMCLFLAIVWPLALPIGIIIKVSEWTHLDGWIDAYFSWLERLLSRRR